MENSLERPKQIATVGMTCKPERSAFVSLSCSAMFCLCSSYRSCYPSPSYPLCCVNDISICCLSFIYILLTFHLLFIYLTFHMFLCLVSLCLSLKQVYREALKPKLVCPTNVQQQQPKEGAKQNDIEQQANSYNKLPNKSNSRFQPGNELFLL